jgi:hypothetical protein
MGKLLKNDRMKSWLATTTLLVLLGSGCVATDVSSLTPEEASASLALTVGDQIVVQPTILGVGGSVVGWLGGEEEERRLTINKWTAGENVALSWSIATQVETTESIAAREAYESHYATSPVGVEIPDEPEPVYEEKVVSGLIASESMAEADTLSLPEAWPEGDGGVSTTSLIWLSKSHYDELVNTRTTTVSLGLFDESLMRVEDVKGQLLSVVDKLSALLDPILGTESTESKEDSSESLVELEANPQWGEHTLLVDDVQTTVRVVEAKNAFASYKILANPDHPLILEIQLTPLSRGNLELLSTDGFAEGFGGYQVTEIHKTGI